jgi:hypothetical protein
LLEAAAEFVGDAWSAAIEEVAEVAGTGPFADSQHEVGAVDPGHVAEPLQLPHPNHRHAVRRVEEGAVENRAEGGIGLSFADAMDARHTDVTLPSALKRRGDGVNGGIEVDGAEADAQNVDAVRRRTARRERRGRAVTGTCRG